MMRKLPEEGIVKLLIHCLTEAPRTHTHIHEDPHCTHQSENPSALGKMPKPGLHPNSLPGPSNKNKSIHRKTSPRQIAIPQPDSLDFLLCCGSLSHITHWEVLLKSSPPLSG